MFFLSLSLSLSLSLDELPYIKVPLHSIMKLTPIAYGLCVVLNIVTIIMSLNLTGCQFEVFDIDVPCVDTYRSKPEVAAYIPRALDY